MKNFLNLFRPFLLCLLFFFFLENVSSQNLNNKWPSLQEQLKEAKARAGTAFAMLIEANQDFSLLREDEKNDLRGLPPWLRISWRKSHPEQEYSASDPTGGYPHVLKELLEWMQTHQDLKPGMGIEPDAENDDDNNNTVVTNRTASSQPALRISGLQTVPRSESDIRINFLNTQKILSGSNNIVASGQQGIYYSIDGGATWAQSLLPLESVDNFHSDPTVEWTSATTAWSSTLGIANGNKLRMRNYFSADNGATWTLDATPSGTQTSVDKQMVWADHNSSSPYFGQMYAIWHNANPAFMSRRTPGAAGTWLATPIQVSGTESTGTCIGSDVKTNSAGHVFGFWPATTNGKILVTKSTDGGNTFGVPAIITTTYDSYDIGLPAFNTRRALIYTSGGAYKTATKNLVYASWTDLSGETGCTIAANEPGSNVAATCKTRIWFARSTDGGVTWQTPIMINNNVGLNDQFNQWLAVDETTGALGIIYYSTQDDPGRKKTHIYYQHSFDDGATWSTTDVITGTQTDETIAGANSGNQYGDYNGLSAFAGILFPCWTDRSSGLKEEIWTAKITDAVLPLKLLSFSAHLQGNDGLITWKISEPAEGVQYELQRSNNASFDNTASSAINAQPGNSVSTLFSFLDPNLSNGTYYYRLKMTDRDGKITFSNVALLQPGNKEWQVLVYPNPVMKDQSIQINVNNSTLQSFQFTNSVGQVIIMQNNLKISGSTTLHLPENISPGIYTLKLITDKGVKVTRILVQ